MAYEVYYIIRSLLSISNYFRGFPMVAYVRRIFEVGALLAVRKIGLIYLKFRLTDFGQ